MIVLPLLQWEVQLLQDIGTSAAVGILAGTRVHSGIKLRDSIPIFVGCTCFAFFPWKWGQNVEHEATHGVCYNSSAQES
eukprot:592752-Amphidinium_carterae.1